MKSASELNNPWVKLILVSLGGIIISLALLWTLQQVIVYNNPGGMNGGEMQQNMNMQKQTDNNGMGSMH
ncbi:MAG: hypothetical protein AB2421_17000 [Thermotaleaceae bacterium]